MKKHLVLVLLFSFLAYKSYGQVGIIKDPVRKMEYQKTIEQANLLYDNKQYTASIHFYKKALEIAPEKKLAKYRLEDIMTIFIKDEMVENKEEAEELIEIINETVKEIEQNLPEDKKDSLVYFLSDMDSKQTSVIDSKPAEWIEIENSVREEINSEVKVAGDEPEIKKEKVVIEIVKDPEIIEEVDKKDEKEKNEEIPESVKIEKVKPQPVIKENNVKISKDLEAERMRVEEDLKIKYPDKKTVEVIQEKQKKITRIIINRDQKVTVYLKVEHNWGGVFYFIDRSPFPVQSITKSYFIKNTTIQ